MSGKDFLVVCILFYIFNFFVTRSKNGWNNNPSSRQFYYTYKRLLLHHDMKEMKASCVPQDNTHLLQVPSDSARSTTSGLETDDISVIKKHGLDIEYVESEDDYALNMQLGISKLLLSSISSMQNKSKIKCIKRHKWSK